MTKEVYRAVVYCRLSKEDGDKIESNSIGSQRAYCEDYLKKQKDIKVVHEPIVDDGVSGVSFERAGFAKLEQLIKNGKVNCIVVRDLSRFARNYIDAGRYLEKIFPQLGVRFIAINDNYDSLTSDPQSDAFVLPFKNLINDTYCKDISVKIRSSLIIKQKNGEYVGAFCPYGYKRDEVNRHKLVIDEDAKETVQLIFSLFKDGMSIANIARRLNQLSVLTPLDYKRSKGIAIETVFKTKQIPKWEYRMVKRILENDIYIGILTQGKRGTANYKVRAIQNKDTRDWITIENSHEAIVSCEDFLAVNELLKRDMRSVTDESENVLSGFLYCGDCGATMVRKIVPSKGKKYIYYVCSNHKKHKAVCSTHSIKSSEVEEKVFAAIHDQVELVVNLEHALSLVSELPSKNRLLFGNEKQIEVLSIEIERYQKLKLRLYEDLTDGVINQSEYFEFKDAYTSMIEEKQQIIARLEKECVQANATGTGRKNWAAIFQENENIEALNRRVLMALVDKVNVYENHALEIVFKYADEYQKTLAYLMSATPKECINIAG